ncbi:MAG: allantoinase PuuE [Alphaproteobacteria bacterium]|nr:allantoinase PuuE [Alphaproteobacteria bacterium]
MTRYDRNMHGYGATPPEVKWPHGAAIAVQFVVNYEEGGERCLLHGDDESEAFLSEVVGAAAWPGQRHWNMESIYEYGARSGFWRLHRLFTKADVPVTVFGVTTALERSPAQLAAMIEADWEIACHGLKWIEHKDMSRDEERAQIRDALKRHHALTGHPPDGWYTGRCSMNTVDLVAEEASCLYQSDSYADDLPYWLTTAHGDELILPYTLDANDMRFATPQGFNSGDQFYAYLKDSFDALYQEGLDGAPKMMSIGLHCRLAGRPGRVMAIRKFIDYAQSHDRVWFARRADIARHWRTNHPATGQVMRPHLMDKPAFMAAFGGIFEHSPWVAEGAFARELGPAHDTAGGLHQAMVQAFRGGTEDDRRAVLDAHPDLAGKLAAAGRLTKESTSEQASAGLDMLTDDERASFTALNDRYKEKFGHPFILAVKGLNKADILAAFTSRIDNDHETEFNTACREVEKIARLRLEDLLAV